MTNERKKLTYTAILIVVLLVVQLSALTYAWLANFVSGNNLGFNASELPPYTLELAKISRADDGKNDETERFFVTCNNKKIETDESGVHLDATLANMSFGTIDNVAQLKPENVVYLRLTVPKTSGNTVNVSFYYAQENFITLYRKIVDELSGEISTEEVTDDDGTLSNLVALESAENVQDAYLLFDAQVSNTAFLATEIADNVAFSQDEATYKRFSATAPQQISVTNENFDDAADNYYVYVKVIPNLSVFAYSIEYLSAVMPCFMYFNVGASFDSAPVV
ncbi:MAG: hypothetical protein ACI4QL_06265 [Candidatus Fimimonas sp.]